MLSWMLIAARQARQLQSLQYIVPKSVFRIAEDSPVLVEVGSSKQLGKAFIQRIAPSAAEVRHGKASEETSLWDMM